MTPAVSYSPRNGSQLTLPTGDSGRCMPAVSDLLLPRFLWGQTAPPGMLGPSWPNCKLRETKPFGPNSSSLMSDSSLTRPLQPPLPLGEAEALHQAKQRRKSFPTPPLTPQMTKTMKMKKGQSYAGHSVFQFLHFNIGEKVHVKTMVKSKHVFLSLSLS